MKECPECGSVLADNEPYCENCGFDPGFDRGSWNLDFAIGEIVAKGQDTGDDGQFRPDGQKPLHRPAAPGKHRHVHNHREEGRGKGAIYKDAPKDSITPHKNNREADRRGHQVNCSSISFDQRCAEPGNSNRQN